MFEFSLPAGEAERLLVAGDEVVAGQVAFRVHFPDGGHVDVEVPFDGTFVELAPGRFGVES